MSIDSQPLDLEQQQLYVNAGETPDDVINETSPEILPESNKESTEIIAENEATEKLPTYIVPKLSPRDSNDPSYTNLHLPYRIICRQRLQTSRNQMRKQIHNEIRHFELDQSKALDGVRIHRVFGDIEARLNEKDIIQLSNKQKRRLEELLAAP